MTHLKRVEIFKPLNFHEWKTIEEISESRNLKAGDIIFEKEFFDKYLVCIEDGLLEMVPIDLAPPVPLAKFYKGSIIGEERLFTQNVPSIGVMVERDSNILIIPKKDLKHLFKYSHRMLLKFLHIFSFSLSDKIRKVNTTLFDLLKNPVFSHHKTFHDPDEMSQTDRSAVCDTPKVESKILAKIKTMSSHKRFIKHHKIFLEGEYGDLMYIIEKGSVRIFKQRENRTRQTIADLGAGDFF